jgi:hypothetical protein
MPDEHFARLREYADDTARQPDFDTIRRRAVRVRRRRRHTASSVLAGVTALVVAALGLSVAPSDGDQTAYPAPSTTPSAGLNAAWPRFTAIVATGADQLFAVYERCRTCESRLHVSADAGRTWERRAVPPPPAGGTATNRIILLIGVAPDVLVWAESTALSLDELFPSQGSSSPPARPPAIERNWITLDGGRTWRRPTLAGQPVDAVPAGTRPVDCSSVREEQPCRLYAVDPATGRFAPLANQPPGLDDPGRSRGRTNVPVGGHLWVPGFDPATRHPAVASSVDGGRTWTTFVFSGWMAAVESQGAGTGMYLPTVAAGTGTTAIALLHSDGGRVVPYRTTDGGKTWQPVPGGALTEVPDAGFVAADGAHVVRNGRAFRASRDGGRYEPVTLAGYSDELLVDQGPTLEAVGRYVATTGEVVCVSDDGRTWRRVEAP